MQLEQTELPITKLLFDPLNMRFQGDDDFVRPDDARFHEEGVQLRAYRKLRDESLQSLKRSILANGFVPVERLVVKKYPTKEDCYIVIEGNRRLAALKWIAEDVEAGVNIPENVRRVLDSVPVIVAEGEGLPAFYESLMGIRHVGGIKQWGGYERAKLIATMRDNYELDANQVSEQLGLSTQEVNRRYRAFKALEQMEGDEDYGQYASPSFYPIFHEALAVPGIREWLGWNNDTASFQNAEQRAEFYDLITPREDEEGGTIEPKIKRYSDVRELRNILPNPEAKRILLDPSRAFIEAISVSKRAELLRSWKAQVAEAIEALRSIGALELQEATPEDLEEIEKLRDSAQSLLNTYEKLKT